MMTSLMCMAVAVFFEARGEPQAGQMAVAQVIMNRLADQRYPDDVCGVVFENKQFSFANAGGSFDLPDTQAARGALEVAQDFMDGETYPINATHYHTRAVSPVWRHAFKLESAIGAHVFYINDTQYK